MTKFCWHNWPNDSSIYRYWRRHRCHCCGERIRISFDRRQSRHVCMLMVSLAVSVHILEADILHDPDLVGRRRVHLSCCCCRQICIRLIALKSIHVLLTPATVVLLFCPHSSQVHQSSVAGVSWTRYSKAVRTKWVHAREKWGILYSSGLPQSTCAWFDLLDLICLLCSQWVLKHIPVFFLYPESYVYSTSTAVSCSQSCSNVLFSGTGSISQHLCLSCVSQYHRRAGSNSPKNCLHSDINICIVKTLDIVVNLFIFHVGAVFHVGAGSWLALWSFRIVCVRTISQEGKNFSAALVDLVTIRNRSVDAAMLCRPRRLYVFSLLCQNRPSMHIYPFCWSPLLSSMIVSPITKVKQLVRVSGCILV